MIEILNPHATGQQSEQGVAVYLERDVEHGDTVAGLRIDARKQGDVALGAAHADAVGRVFSGPREAQLVQRAQAVGVAVEDIEVAHGLLSKKLRFDLCAGQGIAEFPNVILDLQPAG